jgi:phosphopantothenoylcysteine decarboxylase/phosphopantothenate--cysteine ligase
MGVALARAALHRGAKVTLVAAHIEVDIPAGIEVVEVSTAHELLSAMKELAPLHDVVVMAAAVADFRPAHEVREKIKKHDLGHSPTITLVQNPDVLSELGHAQHSYTLVGFAAETETDVKVLAEIAAHKRDKKKADFIVANTVGAGIGFGDVTTTVHIVGTGGRIIESATGSKASVADAILTAIS